MAEEMPTQTFTSADRIRQLNDIDKEVAQLIRSAGLAIQALTNTHPDSDSVDAAYGSLESHKTQFKEATSKYFALLSTIDVRLRRQLYALEEASVLGPDALARTDASTTGGASGAAASAGAGAANPLDTSWLNSRKDTVGKDKEAELWEAARGFVARLDQKSEESSQAIGDSERMQVD
ncbi:hypothetical protein N7532_010888 [Penicillium argentinense]|uniref:Mediator of RNA polymerase II transcription subunit 11 n=1 Tax=Penicillium argentinense TaxID=1131581 RepID=A0A9W9JYZ5_9EURO|nr:uncharacterized protein N7532_010888 [Penicillium argentinense]KAJ5086117.1 hypothetical protein N7532_010888 [Penicillium argentinense]